METIDPELKKITPHRGLLVFGLVAMCFTAFLTARIVWEETALTFRQGPQMVGFALAHGEGVFLLFSPILLALWLVIALVVMTLSLVKKKRLPKSFWLTLAAAVAVLGVLSLPGEFWQWAFISQFAKSAHAADLMTSAAAEGAAMTVRGYLDHGVPLESRNYEGSTAAFTAAAGGSVSVLDLLASRGADLSAINAYGDSPLEASVENKNEATTRFLRAHGAKQVAGTPEQRSAASKAIVERDIQRLDAEEHR